MLKPVSIIIKDQPPQKRTASSRTLAFHVWVVWIFGVIGYLMEYLRIPVAPVVLALVLGPMTEKSFRQSLYMSDGSLAIFTTRPITIVMLIIGLISLFLPFIISTVRGGTH